MSLASHFTTSRCAISFELFPPKTEAGMQNLCDNVTRLQQFDPAFFTCTYGAGGSTQDATLDVLQKVRELTHLPVASHLTCVNSTVKELEAYLTEAENAERITSLLYGATHRRELTSSSSRGWT